VSPLQSVFEFLSYILQAVTHEKVRHHETEEVLRQKEHDRHGEFGLLAFIFTLIHVLLVHHVQHHTQPVLDQEVQPEEHHEKVSTFKPS
jgi:hypothetical protein